MIRKILGRLAAARPLAFAAFALASFAASAFDTPYLTFRSAETFSLQIWSPKWDGTMECSTDKVNWTTWTGSSISAVQSGDEYFLYMRGTGNSIVASTTWNFTGSGELVCEGDIETLRDYNGNPPPMGEKCYWMMFYDCKQLTTPPVLSATTLAAQCYNSMFQGCTALKAIPALPATGTLPDTCYFSMFNGCSSLEVNTTGPGVEWSIPAGTSGGSIWNYNMFAGTGGDYTGNPVAGTTYYVASALPPGLSVAAGADELTAFTGESISINLAETIKGGETPYTFTGSVPTGLTLNPNGTLAGSLSVADTYVFTLTVTDATSPDALTLDAKYTLVISDPDPITAATSLSATVGKAKTFDIAETISGGVPPYSLSFSGTEPTGFSYSSGALSGTATEANTYNFTITATDSVGTAQILNYTLVTAESTGFTDDDPEEPASGDSVDCRTADGVVRSRTCNLLTSSSTVWDNSWYYVAPNTTLSIAGVTVNGKVSLILGDGATLTVQGSTTAGINVTNGNSLVVYCQSAGTGKLVAKGGSSCAGIGGNHYQTCGKVTIYGGDITATGGLFSAGIGGGDDNGNGGTVAIYGGTVTASAGSSSAAGIGKGWGSTANNGTLQVGENVVVKSGTTANPTTPLVPDESGVITLDGKQFYLVETTGPAPLAQEENSLAAYLDEETGIALADTVSGGTKPYAFALKSGMLPAGLSFANGVISGMPSAAASATVVFTVTDSGSPAQSEDFTYTITVTTKPKPITYMNGTAEIAGLAPGEYTEGVGVELPTSVPAASSPRGYELEGWYLTAACDSEKVTAISAEATGPQTFYANWKPIVYSITYMDSENNTALPASALPANAPTTYTVVTAVTLPETATKAGRGFYGWYLTSACTGDAVATIPAGSIENKVFYAKWGVIKTNETYVDANGDSQSAECAMITSDSTALSTGWYIVKDNVTISQKVTVSGDVKIILADDKTLTVNYEASWDAAVDVTGDNSLTIYGQTKGTGALTVTTSSGVAIGARNASSNFGTLTIYSGTITADGNYCGIGGGYNTPGGAVYVYGGKVIANASNSSGAGIGGYGTYRPSGSLTVGANVIVKARNDTSAAFVVKEKAADGTVALAGEHYCKVLTLDVVNVPYRDADGTAKSADCVLVSDEMNDLAEGWYAVTDSLNLGTLGITVSGAANLVIADGASLVVTGANSKAGINVPPGSSLAIYGQSLNSGTVSAQGGYHAAGIGGNQTEAGGTVTINGGSVNAAGGNYGAGIGGGENGIGGTVTINGGTVNATGGNYGAGIGGGQGNSSDPTIGAGGTVTINGGVIVAQGGGSSAGIGGGSYANGGTVTVNGGTVTATGAGGYFPGSGIGRGTSLGTGSVEGTLTVGPGMTVVAGADAESAVSQISGESTETITVVPLSGNRYYFLDTLAPAVPVQTTGAISALAGQTKSWTLAETIYGGTPPYAFALKSGSNLPGALVLANGVISGVAPAAGEYAFTLVVTDSIEQSIDAEYALTVTTPDELAVSGTALGNVAKGASVDIDLATTVTGGIPGYAFAVTSGEALPDGLSLTPAGVLSGAVATAGERQLKITVSDSATPASEINVTYTLSVKEVYAITYKDKDGTTDMHLTPATYVEGTGIAAGGLPRPTKAGWTFLAWYDNAGLQGDPVSSIPADATGDATLYSAWEVDTSSGVVEMTFKGANGADQTEMCVIIDQQTKTLNSGWYVVYNDVLVLNPMTVDGDAKIVLRDGKTMTVGGLTRRPGIAVTNDNSLAIYGQSEGTGTLRASGSDQAAAIGSNASGATVGAVTIYGGTVVANGGDWGAGIGGGGGADVVSAGGTVKIYGGTVTANGGKCAAGIGGGGSAATGGNGGTVEIYGGTVTATGGFYSTIVGAGIGGGYNAANQGTLKLADGMVAMSGTVPDPLVELLSDADGMVELDGKRYYKVEVNSIVLPEISYRDLDGTLNAEECRIVTSSSPELVRGWYAITNDVTFADTFVVRGDVNLIIADAAKLTVTGAYRKAGIAVTNGCALTVWGQMNDLGAIEAVGGSYGAGIGGCENEACGVVTINGGTVTAIGGDYGAGIGGGRTAGGGDVAVNGGIVTAKGGNRAAGIGGGEGGSGDMFTLAGGTVTATGGDKGAGIGGGQNGAGGTMLVNGGTVNARGGEYGAGIGGGYNGNGGTLNVNAGAVAANGGDFAAGVGGGNGGNGGDVIVRNGTVTASSGKAALGNGAGIGSGYHGTSAGSVSIYGGTVTATGSYSGAGIGGGAECAGGSVDISGGTVIANGGNSAAGIGGGKSGNGGEVSITGGTVTAIGGPGNTGIGGGDGSAGHGTLAIGASVVAKAGFDDASAVLKGATAGFVPLGGEHYWNAFVLEPIEASYRDAAGVTQYALALPVISLNSALTGGWYVVTGDLLFQEGLVVSNSVNLILADNATMIVSNNWAGRAAVNVPAGVSLAIYAQSEGGNMGALEAFGGLNGAGIGGGDREGCGMVTINGGYITAGSGGEASAIGGGANGAGGTVTVNGGVVEATGGSSASGIGGGREAAGGTFTLNGGTVTAIGGSTGSGIGGGSFSDAGSGTTTVNGGTLTAVGGHLAAGIGGGSQGDGGRVVVNGGIVVATGGESSAGIGGGTGGTGGTVAINGGEVTATGGDRYGEYSEEESAAVAGAGIGAGGTAAWNQGALTLTADYIARSGKYAGNLRILERDAGNTSAVILDGLQFFHASAPESCTVSYVDMDGETPLTGLMPTSYTETEADEDLPGRDDLTRTGWTFGGWFDNPEFKGDAISVLDERDAGDKKFYAFWIEGEVAPISVAASLQLAAETGAAVEIDLATYFAGGYGDLAFAPMDGTELPDGLGLEENTLSGSFAAPGTYKFVITAVDELPTPQTLSVEFTIVVTGETVEPEFFIDGNGQLYAVKLNGHVDITVPSSVNDIGFDAFQGKTSLKRVRLPDSVTNIAHVAFENCTALTNVTLGSGLKRIGNGAFAGCEKLSAINLPSGLEAIASRAFYGCASIRTISIPGRVDTIDSLAFTYCTSLESVTIGSGVRTIAGNAFYGCSKLGSIAIPDSVGSMGDQAFASCGALTDVEIGNGVTNIGKAAFFQCSAISSLTMGTAVKSIGRDAFWDCFLLPDFTLPDSLESIGSMAFFSCHSLVNMRIPKGVTIEQGAFSECTGIKSVNIGGTVVKPNRARLLAAAPGMKSSARGMLGAEPEDPDAIKVGKFAFLGCRGLETATIGSTVDEVGGGAFSGCSRLGTFNVEENENYKPDGDFLLTKDGKTVVAALAGLSDAAIPSGVETIGEAAFAGYATLTGVTLPGGAKTIGEAAFSNATQLATATLPKSVTTIGVNAFYGTALKTVHVSSGDTSRMRGLIAGSGFSTTGVTFIEDIPEQMLPSIVGDSEATVTGDAESGYVVTPSTTTGTVEVEIPSGLNPAKVTVKVPGTASVKPNGAAVRVVNGANDITAFLDLPAADANGVVNLNDATVKAAIVEEVLDPEEGAELLLTPENPSIKTAPTRAGLTYTFYEGTTLQNMAQKATKVGDGAAWTPTITVKGGSSGFYSVQVAK